MEYYTLISNWKRNILIPDLIELSQQVWNRLQSII